MELDPIADELDMLVKEWRAKFLQQNESEMSIRPTPERWAIAEVLGHLIDSANNNHQRFIRAQFSNELSFPKYDQKDWVQAAHYKSYSWANLVELWCQYNCLVAHLIRNVPASSLSTACTIEPYEPCTLGFLIEDYLVHLKHHLAIVDQRLSELG